MPNSKSDKPESKSFCPEDYIERIRVRAYELYLARGGQHGRDLDDWLEAEKQVRKELGLDK
ncbi:MAG: DUF2934 domain-containing protein [candidate division WOR-3 bacterium]